MQADRIIRHVVCPETPTLRHLVLLVASFFMVSPLAYSQQEAPPVEKKPKEYKTFSNTNIDMGGMQPVLRSPDGSAGEIRWSKETGYYITGGDLGGLQPDYAQEALDLMNKARNNEERGSERAAMKGYKRVFKNYPASPYAPEARYRTGVIFMRRDRFEKAFEEFDIVLRGYPTYGKFNLLLGEQYSIASAYVNGHRKKILWIIPGFTNSDRGVQYFERLIFNAPYSDYAPLSLMSVAVTQLREKNYAYAIDALDRLINAYPNSMVTGDAYLKLAETHADMVDGPLYDQGSTREAITYFEDYLILYPSGSGLSEAEEGLGDMKEVLAQSKFKMAEFYYKKRKNYPAAKVFYNEAITVAPNSQTAAISRDRLDEMEVKVEALREKQTEWLRKKIEQIDRQAAKDAAKNPAAATIDSASPAGSSPAPAGTDAAPSSPPTGSDSATESAPAPSPIPPQATEASDPQSSESASPAKPKKKRFLGIF